MGRGSASVSASFVVVGALLGAMLSAGFASEAVASPATADAVAGWGSGASGRLGTGETADAHALVKVDSAGALTGNTPSMVSAGADDTCVVASGAVYCWGSAVYGLLGHGNLDDSSVPVSVDTTGVLTGKTVTAVAVGTRHACVLASGLPYCWGNNDRGQLGIGSTAPAVDTITPVDVTGALAGRTITSIAVGDMTTCVVASGAAYCWGMASFGLLGNGYREDVLVPTAVDTSGALSGRTVTAISLAQTPTTNGYYGLPQPVCAVADARAFCWGDNLYGEAGGDARIPVQTVTEVGTSGAMSGLDVTAVTAGYQHSCAIASGHAYCWGRNFYGELGNGVAVPTDDAPTPQVPVAVSTSSDMGPATVTAIAATPLATCSLASAKLYCWGDSAFALTTVPTAANPGEVTASGLVLQLSVGLNGGAVLARVDNTPPTTSMTGPTTPVTLASTTRFTWTGADTGGSGLAGYRAYTRSGSLRTPLGAWSSTAITGTSSTRNLAAGQTMCMSVRATDHSGNVGILTPARCVTRPLDQTAATRDAHWWTSHASSFYGGTTAVSRTHGASLMYTGAKSLARVAVVARTGPTAGSVAVYIGSTKVATFNLATNRWHNAVVLTSGRFPTRSGTLKIVITSATGRYVYIDGFGGLP